MPQNINEAIAKAFIAGKSRRIKHTVTDGKTVTLNGNVIAHRPHKLMLRISLGGQRSKTTIERLKHILIESGSGYTIEGHHSTEVSTPNGKSFYIQNTQSFYAIPLIPTTDSDGSPPF
jgi:hypothetical protein